MALSYPDCPLPATTTCTTFLTRGQSMGLSVATESGFVSTTAVLVLVGVIIRNVIRSRRNSTAKGWRFFRSPLDVYMLSLLISDFIQGLGKILDIKWLKDGIVQCGTYCTTQGVIQQLGETGVAQATLAIAVHTFIIIFFRKGSEAIRVAFLIVALIWLYVILFIVISVTKHTDGDDRYITPTPYWCWIGTKFTDERLAGEYFWLWFTAALSAFLYIPLFFCLRGDIEWDEKRWWTVRFPQRDEAKHPKGEPADTPEDSSQGSKAAKEASMMLLYPATYVVLVLPNSICRWIGLNRIPSAAAFFGTSLFGLSGLVNVVLLLYTRPGLLLLNEPPHHPAPGPVWASSASIASSTRDEGGLRLRTMKPVFNMGMDDDLASHPQERLLAAEV